MKHFTGAEASNLERTVLTLFRDYLRQKLEAAPWAEVFAPWGGVDVTFNNNDADLNFGSGMGSAIPFVFLSMTADPSTARRKTPGGSIEVGEGHDIEIVGELVTSQWSGGDAAEQALRDAVYSIVRDGWSDFNALGLEQTRIKPGAGRDQSGDHINPHTVSLMAYTFPTL